MTDADAIRAMVRDYGTHGRYFDTLGSDYGPVLMPGGAMLELAARLEDDHEEGYEYRDGAVYGSGELPLYFPDPDGDPCDGCGETYCSACPRPGARSR